MPPFEVRIRSRWLSRTPLNRSRYAECLQFSALLRQTGNRSREEKLAYAEEVIELLELGPIADALSTSLPPPIELQTLTCDCTVGNAEIGGLGVGKITFVCCHIPLLTLPSSTENRKRVTIGVELAARPDSLLFLDERELHLHYSNSCRL